MRPLPIDDASVDALDEDTRVAIARHWEHRVAGERAVGESFSLLADALASSADGVTDQWWSPIALGLRSAARDEARHVEICLEVAQRYRGASLAVIGKPAQLPLWPGVAEDLVLVLHVLAIACIEESIACVWLDAARRAARAPLPRAALHELLEDETAHAQLGWSSLGGLSAAHRAAVGPLLPALLARTTTAWLEADASGIPEGIADHGVLPDAESREVVRSAVRRVVVPGLARAGIDTRSVSGG